MKTILQLLTITGLLAMTTGCEKLVDVKPESQITEQVYFQSEGDFEPYAIGTYMYLRGSARTGPQSITGIVNTLVYGTERSEELFSALNSRFTTAWNHTITPTNGAFDYTTWYKAIGNCNLLLAKIAEFPFSNEDNKKRIMAEVYCIRAYTYFSLTRIIGDAPLMLEAITGDNVPKLPRSKATDVMTQIMADLDQAINLFPTKTIPSKYRFS
jgi:starch-binding outer membrane protein, SusD/RagB family